MDLGTENKASRCHCSCYNFKSTTTPKFRLYAGKEISPKNYAFKQYKSSKTDTQ